MEYMRFKNDIVVRLDPGDELVGRVMEIAEKENIKLASISGIGASDNIVLGIFAVGEKKYYQHHYEDTDYELASVTGNLSRMGVKPYLHLHAVIGNPSEGKCFGGHLSSAIISATSEIIISIIEGEVGRKFSDNIGLNLFEF